MTHATRSGRRWRVGELADAAGLTVRTIHHYEQVGLLAPAARSEGKQRVYDELDVRRSCQIRALRELGLSLADIGRALGDPAALGSGLRSQLARVDAEIERLGLIRAVLERACVQTENAEAPQDALATIEAMAQLARHIVQRRVNGRVPHDAEARWRAIGDELRACMDAGEDPGAPRARAAARVAQAGLMEFAGGDRATLDALARIRELDPPEALAGWDPALFRYLDRALAGLEAAPCRAR